MTKHKHDPTTYETWLADGLLQLEAGKGKKPASFFSGSKARGKGGVRGGQKSSTKGVRGGLKRRSQKKAQHNSALKALYKAQDTQGFRCFDGGGSALAISAL